MGNDTRFGITMAVTLLMWSPSGLALLRGNQSFASSALWFSLALALAYIGVGVVNKLIVTYGTENAVRDIQEAERRRAAGELEVE